MRSYDQSSKIQDLRRSSKLAWTTQVLRPAQMNEWMNQLIKINQSKSWHRSRISSLAEREYGITYREVPWPAQPQAVSLCSLCSEHLNQCWRSLRSTWLSLPTHHLDTPCHSNINSSWQCSYCAVPSKMISDLHLRWISLPQSVSDAWLMKGLSGVHGGLHDSLKLQA